MGITRTVTTQVYCDVCGKWVIGWESEETGVSREWAKGQCRLWAGAVDVLEQKAGAA